MSTRWRTTRRIVFHVLMILPLAILLPIWVASYAWQGGFVYELDGGECLVFNNGQMIQLNSMGRWVAATRSFAFRNGYPGVGQHLSAKQVLTGKRNVPDGFGDAASRIVETHGYYEIPWLLKDVPKLGVRAYSLTFGLLIVGIVPFLLLAGCGVRDIKRWRWLADNRCIGCGYSKTGLTVDRCPECGRQIANQPKRMGLMPYVPPLSVVTVCLIVGIVLITLVTSQPQSRYQNAYSRPVPQSSPWSQRFLPASAPTDYLKPDRIIPQFDEYRRKRFMPPDIIGPRLPHEMDIRRG